MLDPFGLALFSLLLCIPAFLASAVYLCRRRRRGRCYVAASLCALIGAVGGYLILSPGFARFGIDPRPTEWGTPDAPRILLTLGMLALGALAGAFSGAWLGGETTNRVSELLDAQRQGRALRAG